MIVAAACGASSTPTGSVADYPLTGLFLLTPAGDFIRGATIGSDPVAVIVSDDGRTAYVADSAPGDIYAVRLPSLVIEWSRHVGGAPFALLLHQGLLYVTLYSSSQVAVLDPSNGVYVGSRSAPQHPGALTIDAGGSLAVAGGAGFGVALVGGTLWTSNYRESLLVADGGRTATVPGGLHPFWLAPGAGDVLLVSAEGENEDADRGGVFAYDVARDSFTLLDQPLDPDQAVQWGPAVMVAAHGSRRVDVVDAGKVSEWAKGSAPVAVAPDSNLNLLVVAANAHE